MAQIKKKSDNQQPVKKPATGYRLPATESKKQVTSNQQLATS